MTRRASMLAAAGALLGAATLTLAQQQVGSGHALDASLEVGSYGYNGYTGRSAAIAAREYSPYRGVGRQYLYSGQRGSWNYADARGGITPFDTYLADRQYAPAWSDASGGYGTSYGGQGTGPGNQGLRINYRIGG